MLSSALLGKTELLLNVVRCVQTPAVVFHNLNLFRKNENYCNRKEGRHDQLITNFQANIYWLVLLNVRI